jgi:hypothetical protein
MGDRVTPGKGLLLLSPIPIKGRLLLIWSLLGWSLGKWRLATEA